MRRREFEYIRHGTQALIAALDVHTGQVLGRCGYRCTQDDEVAFMDSVAIAYPGKQVHVIWDNLNTHRAHAVWQAFNARHGERFHFHFTPLHASWVNQIEPWFAAYTRRVLRRASHLSTAHLRERTEHSSASATRRQAPSDALSGATRCKLAHLEPERSCLPYPRNIMQVSCSVNCAPRWATTHDQIVTQAYGRHLLIKRLDNHEPSVVARLSELGSNHNGAAFRSHSGRWEPLPGSGSLDEMAQLVVTLLQPYLQPDN